MNKALTPEQRRVWAEKLGISEPYLYQCMTGFREMEPAKAVEVEQATQGAITRQMLRPKTWQRIWPELAD